MAEVGANGVVERGPRAVRVVGVTADVRDEGLSLSPGEGRVYMPFDQQPGMTAF